MSATPASHRNRSRRRWLLGGGAVLLLLLVGLGALAMPFLSVPDDARAAQEELEQTVSALKTSDAAVAEESVTRARAHADAAQEAAQGLGGDIWSALPWLGAPVDDARHLTQALDDLTSAAEEAVGLYPSVSGDSATLFQDGQVDGTTLERALDGARAAGSHLLSARAELEAVSGSFPVVGDTITSKRDAALAQVSGPADSWTRLEPMLDQLPSIFGFEGRRTYLIALLNPAELRYSGGAALAYAPMKIEDGKITLGASRTVARDPALQVEASWPRVKGNKFHDVRGRVSNATFAPSWSIAGEELLRAWKVTHDRRFHGVIAADVDAMSGLLGTTGGAEVPGYGVLTQGNLAQTLVGSYDRYYPDPNAQDDLNDGLIPVFKSLLFEGGGYLDKARALGEAAKERHFAVYLRDDEAQESIQTLGVDGDLERPSGDYVGVFTQNINGSKADYWQKRNVALTVDLARDGSSRNELAVNVWNDSPPYNLPIPDPQIGYFTRYAEMNLATFLSGSAKVTSQSLDGEPADGNQGLFYDHAFATFRLLLEPAASGRLELGYRVPDAANTVADDELIYRLAVDPQGTITPSTLEVRVTPPQGFEATSLPEGWTRERRELVFATGSWLQSTVWEIPLRRTR